MSQAEMETQFCIDMVNGQQLTSTLILMRKHDEEQAAAAMSTNLSTQSRPYSMLFNESGFVRAMIPPWVRLRCCNSSAVTWLTPMTMERSWTLTTTPEPETTVLLFHFLQQVRQWPHHICCWTAAQQELSLPRRMS